MVKPSFGLLRTSISQRVNPDVHCWVCWYWWDLYVLPMSFHPASEAATPPIRSVRARILKQPRTRPTQPHVRVRCGQGEGSAVGLVHGTPHRGGRPRCGTGAYLYMHCAPRRNKPQAIIMRSCSCAFDQETGSRGIARRTYAPGQVGSSWLELETARGM